MSIKHGKKLALGWILLSSLLTLFLFVTSQWVLKDELRERLEQHLLLTLDESYFGNAQGRVNDQKALQRIGRQINTAMRDLVLQRWYSAQKTCDVKLLRIDGVIVEEVPGAGVIELSLLKNQIDREVKVGLSCSPNWNVAVGVAGILGLFFCAIGYFLPPPLSGVHREWIGFLTERGYSSAQAFDIIHRQDAARLALSSAQMTCLEQLHNKEQQNFAWALDVASDARVAALDAEGLDWLVLGLRRDPNDFEQALALARADDSVVIDLDEMTLVVRGLNVAMSRTPLFYLAWYAMSRISGDGWINNPASNRPDPEGAGELVQLMSRFDGHARAINDLEQSGLKARTLDQNRSKIKEDLVAALGEKLAGLYLFEASKHPDGVRARYRLRVDASRIRVIP